MKEIPEQHGVVSNWSQWGRDHPDPHQHPHHWYLVAAFRSARRDRPKSQDQ